MFLIEIHSCSQCTPGGYLSASIDHTQTTGCPWAFTALRYRMISCTEQRCTLLLCGDERCFEGRNNAVDSQCAMSSFAQSVPYVCEVLGDSDSIENVIMWGFGCHVSATSHCHLNYTSTMSLTPHSVTRCILPARMPYSHHYIRTLRSMHRTLAVRSQLCMSVTTVACCALKCFQEVHICSVIPSVRSTPFGYDLSHVSTIQWVFP